MPSSCEAWPVTWPCSTTNVAQTTLDTAQGMAVDILRTLGGWWLGICTYTEGYWPQCGSGCGGPYKDGNGLWRNGGWMDCCRLLLDKRPVIAVTSVNVQGLVIPATDYELDGPYLRRRYSCWPCDEQCADPPVTIVYNAGIPLPASTGLAVGEVACEVLLAMQGQQCKLPSRAVSITRQGVSIQMESSAEFMKAGLLGLPLTDSWLRLVNRGARSNPSKVYSPDLPRHAVIRV